MIEDRKAFQLLMTMGKNWLVLVFDSQEAKVAFSIFSLLTRIENRKLTQRGEEEKEIQDGKALQFLMTMGVKKSCVGF